MPHRNTTRLRRCTALFAVFYVLIMLPLAHGVEPSRPNFLVILTDDQQFRAIGYNNPLVKTPRLDQLAREGIIFDRTYIASPICMASRASLMTGVFPQEHGAVALDTPAFIKNVVQQHRYPTLPQLLQDAGYATAFCGKSHLGPPRDYGFKFGGELRGANDDETFAYARDFLTKHAGDSPFLLWVAAHQPHVPLLPEPMWLNPYAGVEFPVDPNFRDSPPAGSIYNQGLPGEQVYRDSDHRKNYLGLRAGPPRSGKEMQDFTRAYYATITHLDDQIGKLVDALRSSGQYENTIIVFLADNGYMLGNHGLGNKITMHEESVRVLMFMHGPRLPNRGVRSASLVSSLDIMPTLLELSGLSSPAHLSGASLLPVMRDPEAKLRDYVASECVGVNGTLGTGHRMIRTAEWKYVLTDTNEEYLFGDLQDPWELANLANDTENAEMLLQMRGHMRKWMDQVKDEHARPGRHGLIDYVPLPR